MRTNLYKPYIWPKVQLNNNSNTSSALSGISGNFLFLIVGLLYIYYLYFYLYLYYIYMGYHYCICAICTIFVTY